MTPGIRRRMPGVTKTSKHGGGGAAAVRESCDESCAGARVSRNLAPEPVLSRNLAPSLDLPVVELEVDLQ